MKSDGLFSFFLNDWLHGISSPAAGHPVELSRLDC
jgi:hypothetical protein